MIEIWFSILCLMAIFFIVLDGWDFGAGALHFILARNEEERRVLIAAIGPLWSWHEVWLVGTGGVLFVAFPRVLATGFPAYYLALFLVLWTLILRGISIEFRGHISHPLWRTFWDFTFTVANVMLPILIGTAVGNVLRGMPLTPDAPLSLSLFTRFGVRGDVGILDWYSVSVAVLTLFCLSAHGASYLATKTEGQIMERSKKLAKWLWLSTAFLLVIVALETWWVRPQLFAGLFSRPVAWAGLIVVAGAMFTIFEGWRSGNEQRMFLGSCVLIASVLGTAAASVYPVMLYSTLSPEYSITAWNGSSDPKSLQVAAYWWPLAFAFSLTYFAFIGKHYAGRVQMSNDTQRPY